MGIKKNLQVTVDKLNDRFKRSGIGRTISNPSSLSSIRSRGIEWIYIIILLLLAAGIINAASNASTPGINSEVIVPNPSVQSTVETFISLFGYIVGAIGVYSLFLCGRQTIRARSAEMFFIFGMLLISVAVALGYFILNSK
jgi:hypothetical protein